VLPEAFEAVLRGRHHLGRRTEEGMRKSIESFREAIDLDPTYALAYAGLADAYNIAGYYMLFPPSESFPLAKSAAHRALEIQPQMAEGTAALAYAEFYGDWDLKSAEAHFRRAIELNPNYASAYQYYGNLCASLGRPEEGVALLRRARDLDPLSLIINAAQAWAFLYARDYDEAIRGLRRALELDQRFLLAHVWMGRALAEKGLAEEAEKTFLTALSLSPDTPHTLAFLGNFYGKRGRHEEALRVLNEIEALEGRRYVPAIARALVWAGLGEVDRTFEWLERAYDERGHMLLFIGVDPAYDSLRGDPRFADLLRRIGISV
jgi:tetratricopeptide (TPR) repeat protein